jgi:hypothetical protein
MNAQWQLPRDLLPESIKIMRPHGAQGNEGLALWFGREAGQGLEITHVVDVAGPGFRTSPLHMCLSYRTMAALTDLAEKIDRFLVGQIHAHPGQMLDLSDLDVEQGIRVPDYLSLVCPYYAQRDLAGFQDCGVHVFDGMQYRRLSPQEIPMRLCVSSTRVSVLRCEAAR